MSLVKCPDCGKEVSTRAKSCPSCGCPIEELINSNNIEFEKANNVIIKASKKNLILGTCYELYANDVLIKELNPGETFELTIEEQTTFVVKMKPSKYVKTKVSLVEDSNPITCLPNNLYKYNLTYSLLINSFPCYKVILEQVDSFVDSSK